MSPHTKINKWQGLHQRNKEGEERSVETNDQTVTVDKGGRSFRKENQETTARTEAGRKHCISIMPKAMCTIVDQDKPVLSSLICCTVKTLQAFNPEKNAQIIRERLSDRVLRGLFCFIKQPRSLCRRSLERSL